MKKKIGIALAALLVFSSAAAFSGCESGFGVSGEVKNVILVIGDGMGENHIENTVTYFNLARPAFLADQKGYIGTYSKSLVTDSAAAGTALSTGTKVKNRRIAQRNDQVNLTSISELALQAGKKVGVLTTDTLDGATPAAFSAHANDRADSAEIATSQAKSGIHLFMGQTGATHTEHAETFLENGYSFAYSAEELTTYSDSEKLIATIPDVRSQYIEGAESAFQLKDMAAFALEFLDNENGYFLMIEGAYIDKYSHSNDVVSAVCETRSLFDTVDFLYETVGEDTAILVTADHETGRLKKAASADEISNALYVTDKHSLINVPLFVKNFSYTYSGTPQNTAVFEVCKFLLKV